MSLSLSKLLSSLSIAKATSLTWDAIIESGHSSLESILALSVSDIAAIKLAHEGIIGERARDIHESLHSPRIQALLRHASTWYHPESSHTQTSDQANFSFKVNETLFPTMQSFNIVLTGAGPAPRKELEAILKAQPNCKVQSSVNASTNYLICEDPDANTSKLQKAQKLGVTLLSYSTVFN